MSIWQLVILALVQGLTEFLPISSSAHLILASEVLGWPDQGLAFDTAVHLGTLVAVVLYFWRDLLELAQSPFRPAMVVQRRLLICLAVGSLPALAVGFFAADWIERVLRGGEVIAITTIVFALLLWQADRWGRRQRVVQQLRWHDAVIIGCLQVLALIPGTSRAGITMTAGLWLGLQREAAARFSFLLAIPVLAGAGLFSVLKLFHAAGNAAGDFNAGIFLAAAALSAVVAVTTVHVFVRFVNRVGMLPFVLYRLILGLFLVWVFLV